MDIENIHVNGTYCLTYGFESVAVARVNQINHRGIRGLNNIEVQIVRTLRGNWRAGEYHSCSASHLSPMADPNDVLKSIIF